MTVLEALAGGGSTDGLTHALAPGLEYSLS